jgi:anion-transporting  ArsA/GET3 family ATPase
MTAEAVFFCGKGGVGKSTLSNAFAAFASRTKRVVHVDLALEPQWTRSYQPVALTETLYACALTREACLHEYVERKIRVKKISQLVLQHAPLTSFFDTAPGVEGIIYMGKIHDLCVNGKFDVVVIDAPATGHGVGLFKNPKLVQTLFRVGPLYDEAKMIETWMRGPETSVNLVTLMEELPVQETVELHRELTSMQLKVSKIICNREPSYHPLPAVNEVSTALGKLSGPAPAIEQLLLQQAQALSRYDGVIRDMARCPGLRCRELEVMPNQISAYAAIWEGLTPL